MKYKKTAGTLLAFAVMILLLTVLFFCIGEYRQLKGWGAGYPAGDDREGKRGSKHRF